MRKSRPPRVRIRSAAALQRTSFRSLGRGRTEGRTVASDGCPSGRSDLRRLGRCHDRACACENVSTAPRSFCCHVGQADIVCWKVQQEEGFHMWSTDSCCVNSCHDEVYTALVCICMRKTKDNCSLIFASLESYNQLRQPGRDDKFIYSI